MMKNLIITTILFVSMSISAQTTNTVLPKEFFACWKASYEENNEKTKTQVYRTCNYSKFKPSMFRLEIEFLNTGKCKYLQVGAADNHYYIEGKWTYDKNKKIITVVDETDKLAYKFKIKKINKDVMKVTTLN